MGNFDGIIAIATIRRINNSLGPYSAPNEQFVPRLANQELILELFSLRGGRSSIRVPYRFGSC